MKATEKSPISRWKITDQTDVIHIEKLIDDETIKNYGQLDLPRLIEICSASFTLYNSEDVAVACIILCDYPNIASIKYSWTSWIEVNYGLGHLNALNTQFIHLMAFDPLYYPEFFAQIIEKFYSFNEFLDFVILLLPPKTDCYTFLNMYFNRVHKRKDVTPDQIQACYVNNRWLHFGKFALKKAGEEDGDPITIKVKKKDTITTTKLQYKSIVIHKDKNRTIIIEETPMFGDCISLNAKMDLAALTENYDLHCVNGFRAWARSDGKMNSTPIRTNHPLLQSSIEHGLKGHIKVQEDYGERFGSVFLTNNKSTEIPIDDNLNYEEVVLLDPSRLMSIIPFVTKQSSTETAPQLHRKTTIEFFPPDRKLGKHSMYGKSERPISDIQAQSQFELAAQKKTEFVGMNNAFALELFVSHNKKARSIDYMRKIFEYSPDLLNYCLLEYPAHITLPKITNYFQKLEKLDKGHPYDLYVSHQLAITGRMTVREGWPSDTEDIIGMSVSTLYANKLHDVVHDIFFKELSNKQVFVMLAEKLIIGVAVVSQENEVDYLKSNYELEELMCSCLHRQDEFGLVNYFIVSPLFYHYVRFFLKEIMRQTGYVSLFYKLYSKKIMKFEKLMTWPSALQRWVPVKIRTLGHVIKQGKRASINEYNSNQNQRALFYVNCRIASMTMHLDNRDIVVVGHGVTAMAFIERLVYSKKKCYFNFGNIKLVRPDQLVVCENHAFESDFNNLIPFEGSYYAVAFSESIGIPAFVEIVSGRLTNIDRDARLIEIDFSTDIHYDYLFLLSGTRFVRPDAENIIQAETNDLGVCPGILKGKTIEDYYSPEYPKNLFILDTLYDIDAFIHFIVNSFSHFTQEDCLVVYGGVINAWACLNFLLRYISGKEIAFVENLKETQHKIDAFNNPLIHEACKENILKSQVKYFSSYKFGSWEIKKQNHIISKVSFNGDRDSLVLKCVAFVSFCPKAIHPLTILAVNNCGLDMRGKILINSKFKTNDPRIYAAGSISRYREEYCYDDFNHQYYNPAEVGEKLGDIFLEESCDDSPSQPSSNNDELPPLIVLTEPLVINCKLPCGINYLKVSQPGPPMPFEQLSTLNRIGKIMTTGTVNRVEGPNYFRILLDKFHKVMEITCFTLKEIDVTSLTRLYDKHEQLLNDLIFRYDNKMIKDFYEYFKQPWTNIIYHDRFNSFLDDIFPLHNHIKDSDDKELYLKLANELNEELTEKQRTTKKAKMLSLLNKYGLDRQLCSCLMDFLEYNKDLLPMYLTPSMLAEHEKTQYFMNQLLEPPDFARDHLKGYTRKLDTPTVYDSSTITIALKKKLSLMIQNSSKSVLSSSSSQSSFHSTQSEITLKMNSLKDLKIDSSESMPPTALLDRYKGSEVLDIKELWSAEQGPEGSSTSSSKGKETMYSHHTLDEDSETKIID